MAWESVAYTLSAYNVYLRFVSSRKHREENVLEGDEKFNKDSLDKNFI